MTNKWNFEEEIGALEALLNEIDEETPSEDASVPAKPLIAPDGKVNDLLDRAKEKIAAKYTSVPEAQEALNAVMGQVTRINDALMEMAKCSREFANGEIDEKLRCERIENIMDDIRVPVKELQLQMGRKCDTNGPVTEAELRDFRDYLEGFVMALRKHITNLGGTVAVTESKTEEDDSDEDESDKKKKDSDDDDESDDEDDDKDDKKDEDDDNDDKDNDDEDEDEEDDDDDKDVKEKKKEAKKFTKVCESLMVRTSYESNDDDLASALESLLNDITEL